MRSYFFSCLPFLFFIFQFGVPKLGNKKGLPKEIDEYISHLVECCLYTTLGQETLSFAGYWKGTSLVLVTWAFL